MRHTSLAQRSGKTLVWLLVGLLIGGAAGAGAVYVLKQGKAGVPGGPRLGKAEEVAMIPADSIAFIHLRARDLWKSEEMTDLRRVLDKAGPAALEMLNEGFVPKPSTLDRATLIILEGPKGQGQPAAVRPKLPNDGPPLSPPENPQVVGMLSFSEPFNVEGVRQAYFPNAAAKGDGNKKYYVDEEKGLGLYFANDRVMVVGMAAGVEEFVKKQGGDSASGALARPIALAAEGGRHMIGAINMEKLHVNTAELLSEMKHAPSELRELATKAMPILRARAFAFAVAVNGEDSRLDVRAYYDTDQKAEEAEKAILECAGIGRKHLGEFKKNLEAALAGPTGQKKPRPLEQLPQALLAYSGLGGVNTLDDLLAKPPLKREGSEVVLSADRATLLNAFYGGYAAAFGSLFDAVSKVRMSAARMKGSNNMKQIGIAMHNYHDVNGNFPSQGGPVVKGLKGRDGLSWRVHILPYLEQENLYRQFKLDEPWDSEHNKKLIDKMPPIYVSPLAAAPAGHTYYQVFSTRDGIFFPGSKMRLENIVDGSSNTILTIEGGKPVIWTKPDDIIFEGKLDPRTLALPGQNGINIGMADGAVRWAAVSTLTPAKLAAAITRAGGETLTLDADDGPGEGGLAKPEFIPVPKDPATAPKNAVPKVPPPSKNGGAGIPPQPVKD